MEEEPWCGSDSGEASPPNTPPQSPDRLVCLRHRFQKFSSFCPSRLETLFPKILIPEGVCQELSMKYRCTCGEVLFVKNITKGDALYKKRPKNGTEFLRRPQNSDFNPRESPDFVLSQHSKLWPWPWSSQEPPTSAYCTLFFCHYLGL